MWSIAYSANSWLNRWSLRYAPATSVLEDSMIYPHLSALVLLLISSALFPVTGRAQTPPNLNTAVFFGEEGGTYLLSPDGAIREVSRIPSARDAGRRPALDSRGET